MSLVIDANMKLFAEQMNISSSRMVQDYGLKTVDEIIQAEAEKGNSKAINYASELYHSPAKLIKIFKLNDVENKFVILHKMDDITRRQILPLLDSNDLVMGLYFFTQEKLLSMLMDVDIEELVNVVMGAFPLPEIISKFKDENLAAFFQNDKLEKRDVVKQMQCLPPDVMQKFIEGVTGRPAEETNPEQLINSIASLPDDKFRDFMASIDPDVQKQITFQLTKLNPEYLQLFNPIAYIDMLSTMMKQDMVKPMINLKPETLVDMNSLLPDDLMAIVGAQADTKVFAEFLIDGHLEFLQEALMI